jgi:cardiolipin synthase
MLDPIADKLLIIMVGIVLLYRGDINGINFIPLLLIISREVFISGLREYLAQLKTKIKLPVSNLGKYKTTTQMFALLFLISSPLINNAIISISEIGIALLWVASALSIISGYQYTIKFYKN